LSLAFRLGNVYCFYGALTRFEFLGRLGWWIKFVLV